MNTSKETTGHQNGGTRLILFTGKGGVGKTSTAAATAVKAARSGIGTLIVSTDAAHSLSDAFDVPISHEVTELGENLYGQEVDVNRQIARNWGPIHNFLMQFLRHQGFDSVIADELAVFPGMEEVFSLLELREHVDDPRFDFVVIDCAPTADTARLLALPDIARWYMEKVFRIERALVRTVRPVASRILDVPLPQDDVFAAVEKLYHRLLDIKTLLTDRSLSSIRMVVNPEKMVIKEAQRAFTFLSLFDFGIDAVIVNRLLPPEITDPYYGKWKEIQAQHMELIGEAFSPVPILTARLWDREVVGADLLSQLGDEIYKDLGPAEVLHKEKPVTIVTEDGGYTMTLPLPFASRDEIETWIHGDELTIKYKNFKRNLVLPRTLAGLKLIKAEFRDGRLTLNFGGPK
jgi:arsenite-transporting ATPase